MILELHRQGLSVSAIARTCGIDRKTIRKYIDRGLEAPAYSARTPRTTVIDPFADYLRERVKSYAGLTGQRAAGTEVARLSGRLHDGEGFPAGCAAST